VYFLKKNNAASPDLYVKDNVQSVDHYNKKINPDKVIRMPTQNASLFVSF